MKKNLIKATLLLITALAAYTAQADIVDEICRINPGHDICQPNR